MKQLYLWVAGEGWKSFEYESLGDIKSEFEKRGITIGSNAYIGSNASIGSNEKVKCIFLIGSMHSVNYYGHDVIHIGCVQKTISEWLDQFEQVGNDHNYTAEQITEYGGYIRMIAELHKTWNVELTTEKSE